MNDWNLSNGDWVDANPFGKKVQNFIERYPEYVIYLRKDNRFKCPEHWDGGTESQNSFSVVDHWCWGFGMKIVPQLVPAKISRGRNAEIRSSDDLPRLEPGYVEAYQDTVIFPRAVYPQLNDFILVCEWNKRSQDLAKTPRPRPIRVASIYSIKVIHHQFEREAAQTSCGVDSLDIDTNHVGSLVLNKLRNLEVLDISSTWQGSNYWRS